MKDWTLKDRSSVKEAVIVAILFPCINFGLHLLGWGNGMFNWWQVLLVAPLFGFLYWAFTSSFRKYANEDVTPSSD